MFNLNTSVKQLTINEKLPSIDFGNAKLQVFPFNNMDKEIKLPFLFSQFQEIFNTIRSKIPLMDKYKNNLHYVTIDTRYFENDDYLRREGLHIDGNFCIDPSFKYKTWGGTTWAYVDFEENNEKIVAIKAWEDPYNIEIPIGDYISDSLGGILMISSIPGCKIFNGNFNLNILDAGSISEDNREELNKYNTVIPDSNELYFISSNTPHETLITEKGNRRTFLRITLNHNYENKLILNEI